MTQDGMAGLLAELRGDRAAGYVSTAAAHLQPAARSVKLQLWARVDDCGCKLVQVHQLKAQLASAACRSQPRIMQPTWNDAQPRHQALLTLQA